MSEKALGDYIISLEKVCKTFPGPTRCSWPTNSSKDLGRIRSASGDRD